MPSPTELVAHDRTEAEIAKAIGADLVIFQTLPDLIHSVNQFNPSLKQFDCSVFSGEYVTGGVDAEYLTHIDKVRSDNAKRKVASQMTIPASSAASVVGAGEMLGNGVIESHEVPLGCSGPMNGADETIGLHNTWTATPPNELASRSLVS